MRRLFFVTLFSVFALASHAAITDGLVAYWPFDEASGTTLNDATTNASHGTLYNFPGDNSQWVAGRIGGALNFRGPANADHVRVPNYPKPRTNMTLSAWVWADARPQWATIVKNWQTPGTAQFHFGLQDTGGDLSNYLIQQGGTQLGPVQEGVALPLGAWQHVALVCDGGTMRLYHNGAQVGAPLPYNGTINTNCAASLGIGAKLAAGSVPPAGSDAGYWQGKMDDLGIWTRALSAGEILSIYGAGLEGRSLTNAESTFGGGVVAITEFMASNTGILRDEDGDSSDWIEIYNGTAVPVNLSGWSLTDNATSLRKWLFPSTNLAANTFMIVFASGKNRAIPGAPLHSNFQLGAGGEYLALLDPHTNVVSAFAPFYPPQAANVSYGVAKLAPPQSFITNGSPLRYAVITNDLLGTNWIAATFDDSTWSAGTNFIGYETAPEDYNGRYKTDVRTLMFNRSPSCLIRLPFVVSNATDWTAWKLHLQADDGVVIWLNGEEIIRYFAPDNTLLWNTFSTSNRVDTDVLVGEVFQLTEFQNLIVSGTNMLAIHGLNARLDSSDLLIAPVLDAESVQQVAAVPRYFTVPTPGAPNIGGVEVPGPILSDLHHSPRIPSDNDDLLVTVNAGPALGAVTNVTLKFRVMYSNEVATAMFDDGTHGDGLAGDGIFGATIPASASQPGQMVRYYVTAQDNAGRASRWPLFLDPFASPEYQGTVVRNPAVTSPLPILQWFVQNTAAAETGTGTRCSLFQDDEFYDNVFIRIRGQTSRSYPKKSYKIEMNEEHQFRYRPDQPRVSEFDLNATYTDKSYVRAVMAYEHMRDSGLPCPEIFHVRLQQNGAFYSVAMMVENPDKDFLRHRGLASTGALYKGNQSSFAVNLGLYEKKTPKDANFSDLQAFFNGLQLSGAALENFVFDNIDVAESVNYMATMAITQDIDGTDKNHFFHRDTFGTRLWAILPWDIDLTFGPNALNTDTIVYNQQDTNAQACASHPFIGARPYTLSPGKYNRLLEVLVQVPRSRAMLLRRLRTLTDQFIATGYFTNRMNTLVPLLNADVGLDKARWGASAAFAGMTYTLQQATDRIRNEYLTPRLSYLTGSTIAGVGSANPGSQPPFVPIQFAAVEVNPTSGVQDQEYICLTNANLFAVDLTGWKVRGDVEFEFTAGTVMLPSSALYLSPNLVEFRARSTGPRGGQGLFALGNYRGHLSARGSSVQLLNEYDRPVTTLGYPPALSLAQQFLRVSEIMYHPAPPPAGSTNLDEDFEFIELRNTSPSQTLDLSGVKFIDGIQFNFITGTTTNLPPGARVLVVANPTAFTNRYGTGLPVAGQYLGQLDNGGERIHLVDARGEEILDFAYDNRWQPVTDGHGFSLVILDDLAAWDTWGLAPSWRASGTPLGSPGASDPAPPAFAPIRITEALSTSLPLGTDSIELFNPSATAVDISGWWLSDAFGTPQRFRIPDGTVMAPGTYTVFDEVQFNPGGTGFSLDPDGDDVWLFSATAAGALTGYAHGFSFGAAVPGVSFGRHITSTGEEQFVAQATNSFGTNNTVPRVGPVIISEIMFRPPELVPRATVGPVYLNTDNTRDEFIELHNFASTNVSLADWRLRDAVDYDFPSNAILAPGARLLVVGFDPVADTNSLATFRSAYGISPGVTLLGPWTGKLDNSSEDIELRRPSQYGTNFSHPVIEQIRYRDAFPWPGADGTGASLQRRMPATYGNDPAAWIAATPTPGAGTANPGVTAPTLVSQPADTNLLAYSAASLSVNAAGDAPLRYQWRRNGNNLAGATNATLPWTSVQPQQYGHYSVAVFNAAGSVTSTGALVNVIIAAVISQQPQSLVANVGSNVTFSVGATGSGQLRYQWRKEGVDRPGATNTSLILTNVQLTDSGNYTVAITDDIGTISSQPASLTVLSLPVFLQQPVPEYQEALQGGVLILNSTVGGTAPLAFKWRRNNITALNQTNAQLFLTNVTSSHAGNWTLLVTNLAGAVTSAVAVVVFRPDNDRDGISDDWERQFGFDTNNSADALLDFDGDAMSNLAEYIAGTDPTNPLSYLRVDQTILPGQATLQISAVSNRFYTIEASDAIRPSPWTPWASFPPRTTNRVIQFSDPSWSTQRFYRVRIP